MSNISMNLFSSLRENLIEAVKSFLSYEKAASERGEKKEEKLLPISLRIPSEVKVFFDCVAEKSGQSFTGVIASVLEKAKEETITEYNSASTKIQRVFDYEINSFLQIIDEHKIDYNDLPQLLSWLTGKEIKESDLTDRKKLMDLVTKEAKEKACQLFDVQYSWLKNNSWTKSGCNKAVWYKDIHGFVWNLIDEFYLDETVKSFKVECFLSNEKIVHNILSNVFPEQEDDVIVFIKAERQIGSMKFTTYHQCESQNINYWRSREYFVLLMKTLLALSKSFRNNFLYPSGYFISKESLQLLGSKIHISEIIDKRSTHSFHHLDDLGDRKKEVQLDENETEQPTLEHFLNRDLLFTILHYAEHKKIDAEILIDEKLSSRFELTPKQLEKYLRLFPYDTHEKFLIHSKSENENWIRLDVLKSILERLKEMKRLKASF